MGKEMGALGRFRVDGRVAVVTGANSGLGFVTAVDPTQGQQGIILGNFLSSTSLRSGSPTFGTPEPALGSLVIGQLTRRLGVPLRCSGAFTASKAADAQAMQESAVSMLAALQCGAHFILHSAGWLEGGLVMSYEKFIMDADQLGMMQVLAKGVDLSENGQALDAIREVGPGSHFLGCSHTQANFETAFYRSSIADNNSFEQWESEGSKDMAVRANASWKKQLAEYEPPPLDPAVDEALRAPPDVAVLDVKMPGFDGFEACRRLKADPATQHVPVLLLSGILIPITTGLAPGSTSSG